MFRRLIEDWKFKDLFEIAEISRIFSFEKS